MKQKKDGILPGTRSLSRKEVMGIIEHPLRGRRCSRNMCIQRKNSFSALKDSTEQGWGGRVGRELNKLAIAAYCAINIKKCMEFARRPVLLGKSWKQ